MKKREKRAGKDYKKKWFDIIERLLESLAKSAALRSYQLVSRAKPVQ